MDVDRHYLVLSWLLFIICIGNAAASGALLMGSGRAEEQGIDGEGHCDLLQVNMCKWLVLAAFAVMAHAIEAYV
jgi:hypothetical protein